RVAAAPTPPPGVPMYTDALDLPLSGGSGRAVALYDDALHLFQCHRGEPLALLAAAVAEAPAFVMGHVLIAWLHLLSTEPAALPPALAALDRADAGARGASPRERAHLHAARLWAQ